MDGQQPDAPRHAGPYLIEGPLLAGLSGGSFGAVFRASDAEGRALVAKTPRTVGGSIEGTEGYVRFADGSDGVAGAPHLNARAFLQATGGGDAPWVADAQLVRSVLQNEAAVLERDAGRLLPRSYGLWTEGEDPVLVMERLAGGPPSTAAEVVALLEALADAVHRGSFVCHGDVKAEHVFIRGGRVRLCDPAPDFGMHGVRAYTPAYNPHGYRGAAADIAGCATILRYLPDSAGWDAWDWCEQVLRGPAPPAWTSSHREALSWLRAALDDPVLPPPGWTRDPLGGEAHPRGGWDTEHG